MEIVIQTDSSKLESRIEIEPGGTLFVVGPNGAGKSTLLHRLSSSQADSSYITGNREIVFDSSAVAISAKDAKILETQEAGYADKRYRTKRGNHNNASRLSRLLFKLKTREDHHNAEYVRADQGLTIGNKNDWLEGMPVKIINNCLRACAMRVELVWTADADLVVNKEGVSGQYAMSDMSDGERAAIILAGEAILAKRGALMIVDEPERHLHRSITAPLLSFLKAARPDLHWCIATHDLALVRDDSNCAVLVVYSYDGAGWVTDYVPSATNLPASLIEAIYGAQEIVLCVEGLSNSLDHPLYVLLYPSATIQPVGSRTDVERAVAGVKSIETLYHIRAGGIVDADNDPDEEDLRRRDISVLKVYAVESLYYHPDIIALMRDRQGISDQLESIIGAARASVTESDIIRLGRSAAYKKYTYSYLRAKPGSESFDCQGRAFSLPDGAALVREQTEGLRAALEASNWTEAVKVLALKSTRAPKIISEKLGFRNEKAYEMAVRKLLIENEKALQTLRELAPAPANFADTFEEISPLQRPHPDLALFA